MFRSKATAYAILAAAEVAGRSKGQNRAEVQSAAIAEAHDLPVAYASKVMGQLAKARVLRSVRGPRGGFTLARPANQITLLEIFEAVQGKLGEGDAPELPAAIGRRVNAALNGVAEVIRQRLGAVTLASLTKK